MWFNVEAVDLDYIDRAPFSIRNEVVLEAAPDAVFDLLVAVESWPDWFHDFVEARWLTEPPHGVGSIRLARLKQLAAKERFLAWEPAERWTFCLVSATVPLVKHMVEDYRLEPVGDGQTRLLWHVYYKPRTLVRPLHAVVRPIFTRMFARATRSLAQHVREQQQESAVDEDAA